MLILLGLAAIALLVWTFRPQPVAVQVAQVTHGSFQQMIEEDGKTRVRERYVVSAPLMGKLQRITLKAGDRIQQDQVVATILPSAPALLDLRSVAELTERVSAAVAQQARAAVTVARAQAALEKTRADLNRAQKLAASRFISPAQLEQSELEVKLSAKELEAAQYAARAAQHNVATARAAPLQSKNGADASTATGKTWQIIPPVAGKVLKVLQESESVVTMGTPLLEIGNPEDQEIVVDVLTSDATLIKPGDAVQIMGGDQAARLQGQVRQVEPSAFTKVSALGVEEQRVNVIVDLISPAQQWQTLGNGYRVETRIIVFNTADAVTVPVSALFRKDGQWMVFVFTEGRARLRKVNISRQGVGEAMVTSGLQSGERVVVYPGDRLADGSRVTVR
ncbi:efflux RND transporter periplasmic adaptor subunit [Sulfuriferula sp.]|uniref:efflux RND transporter periplasmic adaptor subunit n=1 Tax=Sulfuriferula sp. TaxID=2025307 RepID=UPI00272FCBE3|nr:HlyD family efflux transporter periplasmic adaptor subunit [Sulfuriferula sp.]MDP2025770.1 HlyD family efflux transporter periplasmic adaptor subunit [Sulfuriferula sp.]